MANPDRPDKPDPGSAEALPTAGLLRRLAAVFYDGLLLLAMLMLSTAVLLVFTRAEAIRAGNPFFRLYLLIIIWLFFAGFWTRDGQTLGMRAWRLKLESRTGDKITWRQASLRLAAATLSWAVFGLGYLWVIFDRDRLAWHDRLSQSRPVVLPRARRQSPQ